MKREKLSKEQLLEKLKNVQLITLDADGTLTDGSMYVDNNGLQTRKYFAHDGTGISMVRALGIKVIMVTTSEENVHIYRSDMLGLDGVIKGSFDKGKDIEEYCNKNNIPLENTMHIGDDVNDISAFVKVGIPVTMANGVATITPYCCYITKLKGGEGAIREICDLILLAKTGKLFGKPYIPDDIADKL